MDNPKISIPDGVWLILTQSVEKRIISLFDLRSRPSEVDAKRMSASAVIAVTVESAFQFFTNSDSSVSQDGGSLLEAIELRT
jgi:hypothetical protein